MARIRHHAAIVALVLAAGCGGGSGSGAKTTASVAATTSASQPLASPSPAAAGPTVVSASWDDRDHDGKVSPGDAIVVRFSSPITIGKGAKPSDFTLPVSGDTFGAAASVTSASAATDVAIVLSSNAVLTISGTFDPHKTKGGSPSGIDLAAGALSITDAQSHPAVSSVAVDVTGLTRPGPSASPSPAAPTFAVTSVDFNDVNQNGVVDLGDSITLHFSSDVVLGTGSNAPSVADFVLPVAGDKLGLSAFVKAGKKASDVLIVVGMNPVLTVNGTFDKTATTAGSPSGIGAAPTLTAAKLASKTGQKMPADLVDVGGTLGPPTGPQLTGADFKDMNQNGKVDAGDYILLHFNKAVTVNGNLDPSMILLPVSGDSVGTQATAGWAMSPNDVQIQINDAGALHPDGTFDSTIVTAGSPTGIGLSSALPTGTIVDATTGQDVATNFIVDLTGVLVAPTPPTVVSVVWVDRDLDGKASAGDWLVVEFNEPVTVDPKLATVAEFALAVSGDAFGSGASVQRGPGPAEATIVLGASPVLTVKGAYANAKLSAGSPSGLDVAASPVVGAILNARGIDPVAATIAWDLAEPLGALDNPMSVDSVKDAAATTADWNVSGSGKVAASKALDTGTGTDSLLIDADTTIDTIAGTIGGSPSTGFRGAGVFEFATIQVNKGVNVTVTGKAGLTLKATSTAIVDGTFIMDGAAGGDQLSSWGGGTAGPGGAAGPGGEGGGTGAAGGITDLRPGAPGSGPWAGLGGGTALSGGAGGGAGFATAGTAGADGQPGWTPGPVGTGGVGGVAAPAGALALVPAAGGSGGGGGGALQDTAGGNTSPGAGGGGGGGSFRLVAGGEVRFGGVVSVKGGKGGDESSGSGGGGGGGAGGAVLIQSSANVSVASSATLDARGGPGGIGTQGGDGSDGVVRVESNGAFTAVPASVTGTVNPLPSEGIASASLDVGSGTVDLVVSTSATLDTDQGTLGGTPVKGFKGSGVFEVANFSVASGATLTLAGTSPLFVKCTGKADVSGTIDASGLPGGAIVGLAGGKGSLGRAGGGNGGNGGSLTLGSGQSVASQIQPTAGTGAGAGTAAGNGDAEGGGGGSFGSAGADGTGSGLFGFAGTVYGTDDLATLQGGSGGGGGSANTAAGSFDGGSAGGAGGGAVAIHSKGDMSLSGSIQADGGSVSTSPRGGCGGGGSGGAVALRSVGRISISGSISAIGGDGGLNGGAGGNGRIRLEDSAGSFMPGTISPAIVTGAFTTSVAVSTWIRTQAGSVPSTAPRYLAIVGKGAAAGSSAYSIELEGARDSGGAPDLTTATGFTTDSQQLSGNEFLRFRITLRAPAGSSVPEVDRIYVPFK